MPAARSRARRRSGSRSRLTGWVTAALVVVLVAVAAVAGTRWVIDRFSGTVCTFTADGVEVRLTPEQAANAATITMVSVGRDLPRRSVTIALATAMQESKLRNLNYGHADSLGLFQQRPSQGWGTADEVRDPVYAANAFYDHLRTVQDWQQRPLTEAAQAVQRSAYPDEYAKHEDDATVLASVLTGASPAGLGCTLPPVSSAGSPRDVLDKAERAFDAQGTVRGGTVTITAGSAASAWAVASWAVAHAEAEGITQVRVADRRWSRADDPGEWTRPDEAVQRGRVVIDL